MKIVIKKWLLTCFCLQVLAGFSPGGAQQLNYGLGTPQPDNSLPVSKAPVVAPALVRPVLPKTVLKQTVNGEFLIEGGWQLKEARKKEQAGAWYNAIVPGTVLTTLVNQGVYPDPYFGLHNLAIPDSLCRQSWVYQTKFDLPVTQSGKRFQLLFNGINYSATIWLNGRLLGKMKGAFTRGCFDAGTALQARNNLLVVQIDPPLHPGIPHEESARTGMGPNGGTLCWDGPTFISSEGWDWIPGIRDRNIGIWQDVRLKISGDVLLQDPQVITDLPLPDTSSAAITVRTRLVNKSNVAQTVTLKGAIGDTRFDTTLQLKAGSHQLVVLHPGVCPQLQLQHPRLWWPNGYGEPALHTLQLELLQKKGAVSDKAIVRFGIREFSYELAAADRDSIQRYEYNPLAYRQPVFDNMARMKTSSETMVPSLQPGSSLPVVNTPAGSSVNPQLVIKVNGVPVYCKGGNWGMDDGMKRCSRERLEPYIKLHRNAHFNMVRNWTGESTEEVFYELCDEYGLLVWNDFWMSTGGYNLYPQDNELFLQNAKETILRFRNHPSIVIWCARNEGYPEEVIEKGLARLIAEADGTRHYQPNSRLLNLKGSGPWHYFSDPANYFRYNAGGFSTELGTPAIPTAASMRRMMAKEDLWPIGDVWHYHDLHSGQLSFRSAIDSLYGAPRDLDDFCRKAQLINYDSHRAMFEAWNNKLWNDASGLLLWMTHPAWPSTVWQVYSWDYETFAAYHASQKACEPVHIQMNLHDKKVIAVNTTQQSRQQLTATVEVYDINGKSLHRYTQQVSQLPANARTGITEVNLKQVKEKICLVRLALTDANNTRLSQNEYWMNAADGKDFRVFDQLPVSALSLAVVKKDIATHTVTVLLRNTSAVPALQVKTNLVYAGTGTLLLPAFASDGYFTMLPGEERLITVQYTGDAAAVKDIAVQAEGYNLPAVVSR